MLLSPRWFYGGGGPVTEGFAALGYFHKLGEEFFQVILL